MKTITITDIAKASGVSIKTVSRVLNAEANVSDSKRELVKKTAKQLGYQPNISARMLRSQRSHVLVHFHDNPNADYLENIYKGVSKTARDAGYFAVMEPVVAPYTKNAQSYLDRFRVDGVILSPPLSDDVALLKSLTVQNVPFVRISPRKDISESPSSYIDDVQAAGRMTKYLMGLGHEKIAFLSGPAEHGASIRRQRGFENAVNAVGGGSELCPVLQGDFSVRSGFELCGDLLANQTSVTAIFAANDDMAIGAVMGALKAGVDVPKDLSVAGFDGSRLGEIIWPQLTTIFQPIEAMAVHVTAQLLFELAQPGSEKIAKLFDVELLERGTTTVAPQRN